MKESFPGNKKVEQDDRELVRDGGTDRYPRYVFESGEASNDDEHEAGQVAAEHESAEAVLLEDKERNGWLDEKQAKVLRATLLSLGVLAGGAEVSKRIDTDGESAKPAFDENPTVAVASGQAQEKIPETLPHQAAAPEETLESSPRSESAEVEEQLSQFEREVLERQQALKPEDVELTLQLAMQPAEGTGGLARMEFIQKAYTFDEEQAKERGWSKVPAVVWDELGKIVPGWVGQESRFDEKNVSISEAKGPWQYLPIGWKDVRGDADVSTRFDEQAEASKDTVVKNYKYIHHYAGTEEMETLQSKFDSEEEYLRDFLTKVLLTAHNAGGKLIGNALKKFVADVSVEEMKSGKELFLQFMDYSVNDEKGDFAKYNIRQKEEKRGYVPQIYALGNALKQKRT